MDNHDADFKELVIVIYKRLFVFEKLVQMNLDGFDVVAEQELQHERTDDWLWIDVVASERAQVSCPLVVLVFRQVFCDNEGEQSVDDILMRWVLWHKDKSLQHVEEKLAQLAPEERVLLNGFDDIETTLKLEVFRQNGLAASGRAIPSLLIKMVFETPETSDVAAWQDDWFFELLLADNALLHAFAVVKDLSGFAATFLNCFQYGIERFCARCEVHFFERDPEEFDTDFATDALPDCRIDVALQDMVQVKLHEFSTATVFGSRQSKSFNVFADVISPDEAVQLKGSKEHVNKIFMQTV